MVDIKITFLNKGYGNTKTIKHHTIEMSVQFFC